jgi:hypothetical protein
VSQTRICTGRTTKCAGTSCVGRARTRSSRTRCAPHLDLSRLAHAHAEQKMDLGACPKSHTERLKTEFNAAREANAADPIFERFQREYEGNIFSFVDECDRRIRAAHRRLEKTPEENAKTTNLVRRLPCWSGADVLMLLADERNRRVRARHPGRNREDRAVRYVRSVRSHEVLPLSVTLRRRAGQSG